MIAVGVFWSVNRTLAVMSNRSATGENASAISSRSRPNPSSSNSMR